MHHFVTAEGVNIEHPYAESSRFDTGFSNRIWDVVKLQVKEDLVAGIAQLTYKSRPFRGEHLQPDLECAGRLGGFSDDPPGFVSCFDIKRNYQSILCRDRRLWCHLGFYHRSIEVKRVSKWSIAGRICPFQSLFEFFFQKALAVLH